MTEILYHVPKRGQPGFFDTKENRFWFGAPLTHQNPFHKRRLADRVLLQLLEEGVDLYSRVSTEHIKAYNQTLNRKGVRRRSLPQEEGVTIVLSQEGTRRLPEEEPKRIDLLKEWIANIPPKGQIGGTRDFGGKHAGFSFGSKEPGRHIKLHWDVDDEEVLATLKADEKKWAVDTHHNIFLLSDKESAIEYVKEKFVS